MNDHLIAAYAISFVMLWGYAALLWIGNRRLARRQQREGGPS